MNVVWEVEKQDENFGDWRLTQSGKRNQKKQKKKKEKLENKTLGGPAQQNREGNRKRK